MMMTKQIKAYQSSTGTIFSTREEANMDEIREAVDFICGLDKDDLIGIAAGRVTNTNVRDAIVRLAEAINPSPEHFERVA
jgi:hypothetical protein